MNQRHSSEREYRAGNGSRFILRDCQGFEELDACVQLQMETWGYEALEVVPRKLFLLAQKIGGQVIGAFPSDPGSDCPPLVGFAMALPGFTSPEEVTPAASEPSVYLHSHMLAVRPEYRDQGLGRALKFAQRVDALARGIKWMAWTFDPLETKNAFLNINRLGAVARRYSPNFYGVSSSRLHGGLPTDRLHAEWPLDGARARRAADGQTSKAAADWPVVETIVVPSAASDWKHQPQTPEGAECLAQLQAKIRERFLQAFARGLAVTGFQRDGEGTGTYELTEWDRLRGNL